MIKISFVKKRYSYKIQNFSGEKKHPSTSIPSFLLRRSHQLVLTSPSLLIEHSRLQKSYSECQIFNHFWIKLTASTSAFTLK